MQKAWLRPSEIRLIYGIISPWQLKPESEGD